MDSYRRNSLYCGVLSVAMFLIHSPIVGAFLGVVAVVNLAWSFRPPRWETSDDAFVSAVTKQAIIYLTVAVGGGVVGALALGGVVGQTRDKQTLAAVLLWLGALFFAYAGLRALQYRSLLRREPDRLGVDRAKALEEIHGDAREEDHERLGWLDVRVPDRAAETGEDPADDVLRALGVEDKRG